jgi:hypothetical protein
LATSNKNFKVKNGLDVGGAAEASSFVKTGGAANQFLKADGSISNGGSAQVSATPPSYPASGDLWYNSETGQVFVYYDSYWVENIAGVAGPQGTTGATGAGVPVGGTAGQVLAKVDSDNYDTQWINPPNPTVTTVRTNLVANPGFEINTTHWYSTIYSINRVSTTPHSGSWCVESNYDSEVGSSNVTYLKTNSLVIGSSYRAGVYVRVASGTSTVNLNVNWGAISSQTTITATTSWQFLQSPPEVATSTTASFGVDGLGDTTMFVDSAIIELASTHTGYFDGNTPDASGIDYAWTGTANASTSTATSVTTVNVDPTPQIFLLMGA